MSSRPGRRDSEKIINLGFNNAVAGNRVVAVVDSNAKPIKRLVEMARKSSKLIDATAGRKTRCVVVTDSDHVILSSLQPQTLIARL